jgi:hypothetical protein
LFIGFPTGSIAQLHWENNRSYIVENAVQTTERYLGCKQRLRNAVDDKIGLEPVAS